MSNEITSELVEAYAQCPRKALLLLKGEAESVPHEYERILKERADENRLRFIKSLADSDQSPWEGRPTPADPTVTSGDLTAKCDALSKSTPENPRGGARYEPCLVTGTHSITKEQKLRLGFAGSVIGKTRRCRPARGFLVTVAEQKKQVKLEVLYPTVRSIVNGLRDIIDQPATDEPSVVLSKHCPVCQFRQHCQRQAEEEDNLSCLERMTPNLMRKYQKKGIFTVTQLSYLYRPRRRRKRRPPVTPLFNIELQALALRTGKVYLHAPLTIPEHPVELFLDIEGIPDESFYYLIGLLVKDHDGITPYSFWADSPKDEASVFRECVNVIAQHPDAPVYHYGSYESKAFAYAVKQYGVEPLEDRLVNVNSFVFGRVYFPA